MKVLLIDVNCKSSSTGQIVYNLFSHINECGDEAAICYGRGKKIKEKNIYKFGIDLETVFHACLTRITGYTGCFSFFSTLRLIRFIKKYKPDVVHIHELHAYFVNIKQLLSYLAKNDVSVIHTLHCEFSYTGKCGHSIECDRWKNECGKCPHLNDYPSSLVFDHTRHMHKTKRNCFLSLRNAIYVAPSQWLVMRIKQSFLSHERINLVHNSIDTSIFCPGDKDALREKYGFDLQEKIVLAVAPGLMNENKGGKYVIELANRMKDALFILIGSDETPFVNNNIVSLGKVYDKQKLAHYYSLSDVFLICSKNENFPTTCIEALCCGTPVVGFDVGGVKETTPEELGLFCEYGDIKELEECVHTILTKEYLPDAFKKIRAYYSRDRMCMEYEELYKQLLARKLDKHAKLD